MQITITEANHLMGEIIEMLKNKGVKFDNLGEYADYDDVVTLIHCRDGFKWNSYRQTWVKIQNRKEQ